MKIIKRDSYLDTLIELIGTPDIKIITGIRRSGKSELMKSFVDYLSENKDYNVIYIDLVPLYNEPYKNYHKLDKYIKSKYVKGKKNLLIIDEVQLCKNFEIVINSVHASKNFDIYITGSNAFLLSSDLATLFTGRYIEIHVFPFSYKEYLNYYGLDNNLDSLNRYLLEGGLAGAYPYSTYETKRKYIEGVYNTIIERDLVEKKKISNPTLLTNISDFLMDNISNITSVNNISNILNNNKFNTNHNTVRSYIAHLCEAFIFYKIKRYDIKGKKYLDTNDKYYLVDPSLRLYLHGRRNFDYGRAYENMVAIELLRRGYEVYVGKLYDKEVDFVAIKGNEKLYIQVADNIEGKKTLDRELHPLHMIKDAYPKILIANTNHDTYDIDGIKIINLSNWLYEK